MFYSATTAGFYDRVIHGGNIPADAVEITSEEHAALLVGQSEGKIISADADGKPVLVTPAGPTLEESIVALVKQIDADVDAIYQSVIGYRATEYAEAESQAKTFKEAHYVGEVPVCVQGWADAKAKSAQWAADDILATSAAWRTAQAYIRTQRLAAKVAAGAAEDEAALGAVKTAWAGLVTAIREQLGVA